MGIAPATPGPPIDKRSRVPQRCERDMTARYSTRRRTGWRILAAVVLLVWTSSLALCTAHCSLGTPHLPWTGQRDAVPSCHAAPVNTSDCHSDSSEAPASDPIRSASSCATFKNLFANQADGPVSEPPEHVLYIIAENILSTMPDLSVTDAFDRQHHPSDFILTPEVSLGPAARSLAPPQDA